MTRTIGLIPLVSFFLLLGACSGDSVENPVQSGPDSVSYTLCFGSNKQIHEESGPQESGGGKGESVIVRLNGHPIWFKWNRSALELINQLMVDQENVLEIEGRISTTMYLRLNKYDGTKNVDLVHETIDPQVHNKKTKSVFKFSDKVPYRIVTEIVKGDDSHPEAVKKSVLESAKSLYEAMSSGKHAAAASLLGEGYRDWAHVAYGQSRQDIDRVIGNYKKFFQSEGFTVEEPDWDKVTVVIGKRSVLVYAGWNCDSGNPFLFTMRTENSTGKTTLFRLWALRFVYQKGRWVIWSPQ